MAKRNAFLFPLLISAIVVSIAVASVLPAAQKSAFHIQGSLHPWLHFCSFGLLALCIMTATRSSATRVVLLAAMLAFGWATEFGEHLRNRWPVETADVFADSAGGILGSLVALVRDKHSG